MESEQPDAKKPRINDVIDQNVKADGVDQHNCINTNNKEIEELKKAIEAAKKKTEAANKKIEAANKQDHGDI